jgi:hypothetical protein
MTNHPKFTESHDSAGYEGAREIRLRTFECSGCGAEIKAQYLPSGWWTTARKYWCQLCIGTPPTGVE